LQLLVALGVPLDSEGEGVGILARARKARSLVVVEEVDRQAVVQPVPNGAL
jgi:hypothetical protein